MSDEIKIVYDETSALRVDLVLFNYLATCSEFNNISRTKIQSWLKSGHVSLNSKQIVKANLSVKKGDILLCSLPKEEPLDLIPFDYPLEIIFEDQDLLVLNKPAGIIMHPGAAQKSETLLNAVVKYLDQDYLEQDQSGRLGIVHRLDKDTTGLVVIAKSASAHFALSKQFEKRSVGRIYEALVLASPRQDKHVQVEPEGSISTRLGRHQSKRTLISVVEQGGRIATTNWKLIENYAYACLLELILETGRTHQIRVHLNHLGSPVIGDQSYGDFSALPKKLGIIAEKFGRQALHAQSLEFDHPRNGERLKFVQEAPKEQLELISEFRDYQSD